MDSTKCLWPIHKETVQHLQEALYITVKLSHPKEKHVTSLFMDALKTFWASLITQIQEDRCGKRIVEQQNEPLAFLVPRFVGAQRSWTTYEKEAYATLCFFDRKGYILWGPHLCTCITINANYCLNLPRGIASGLAASHFVLGKSMGNSSFTHCILHRECRWKTKYVYRYTDPLE